MTEIIKILIVIAIFLLPVIIIYLAIKDMQNSAWRKTGEKQEEIEELKNKLEKHIYKDE